MDTKKDLTVFIGRFSPFHNGHAAVLRRAIKTSKAVLVLIGSAGKARDTKNPFTGHERNDMIYSWIYSEFDDCWVTVRNLNDHPYNDSAWIRDVQNAVDSTKKALEERIGLNPKVYITGADRDRSTWYLKAFGDYFIPDIVEEHEVGLELSATQVREILFNPADGRYPNLARIADLVPTTTLDFLKKFITENPAYGALVDEYSYIEKYKSANNLPDRDKLKKRFSDLITDVEHEGADPDKANELRKIFDRLIVLAPYAPVFSTVDACVIQSGHVLVNTRANFPGKGLLALPGGFLEQHERLIDGSVRELIEETRIELSKAQLYGSIRAKEVFDHPDRSLRGRTVTTCFLYKLDDTKPLPKIKPQKGEVKKVEWMPISEALKHPERWFEDHYHMLETMLARDSVRNI